jgi:exosome complex RNA-binding protein Rrp42 (RNase PH superfamily)
MLLFFWCSTQKAYYEIPLNQIKKEYNMDGREIQKTNEIEIQA